MAELKKANDISKKIFAALLTAGVIGSFTWSWRVDRAQLTLEKDVAELQRREVPPAWFISLVSRIDRQVDQNEKLLRILDKRLSNLVSTMKAKTK